MKKINNKGLTLIELIISFALVAVAIIYFYQTLFTVKKLYTNAQKGTQAFVDKDYALRLADAYIENHVGNVNDGLFYEDDKYKLSFVNSVGSSNVTLNKCVFTNGVCDRINPYYISIELK